MSRDQEEAGTKPAQGDKDQPLRPGQLVYKPPPKKDRGSSKNLDAKASKATEPSQLALPSISPNAANTHM